MITFLGQETLSASGVGDHISSSRNCETDNGYKDTSAFVGGVWSNSVGMKASRR